MPPEENKTQDVQQDPAPIEPAVAETPMPVEQPAETASVDIPTEITPEPVPAPQAQEENPVAEPVVETTTDNLASPEERPLSAPLPEDSPPASQPTPQPEPVQEPLQPQIQERIVYKTDPNIIQKLLIKARAKIQERKRKKLDKIMTLFEANPQVTNKDIQKALRISSATATRYLDILERENRIKQVGSTGKSVFYTKI